MKFLLKSASKIYAAAVQRRNRRFDSGAENVKKLDALTISVGNITVGGTGKTPFVASVAKILAEKGLRPCVLTRGYKRENEARRVVVSDGENILADARTAGDEPLELALKLRGAAAVVADRNRFEAGVFARRELNCGAFILDDGFQHRKLFRHLDILTVDATNPFGNGALLPYGILREPLENMARADIFIITRADLVEKEFLYEIEKTIRRFAKKDSAVFHAVNKVSQIVDIEDLSDVEDGAKLEKDERIFAFCGLGNSENFYALLRKNGFQISGTQNFRDHHRYTSAELAEIEQKARQTNAETLITTAKDAVKLSDLPRKMPLRVCLIEAALDNEKDFRQIILSRV